MAVIGTAIRQNRNRIVNNFFIRTLLLILRLNVSIIYIEVEKYLYVK